MSTDDSLAVLLHDARDLENFFHDFIGRLAKRRPKAGEDVTRFADEFGLKMPASLKGVSITWVGGAEPDAAAGAKEQTLTFVRPGDPAAVGLTLGCIHVGRYKICLECSWIFCRIVISGRF